MGSTTRKMERNLLQWRQEGSWRSMDTNAGCEANIIHMVYGTYIWYMVDKPSDAKVMYTWLARLVMTDVVKMTSIVISEDRIDNNGGDEYSDDRYGDESNDEINTGLGPGWLPLLERVEDQGGLRQDRFLTDSNIILLFS